MATTYTLQVNLDDTEMATLKNSGYSLCIAKKVNNVYNVVWQGISFLAKNTFQWTEEYGVFGQVDFTSGALINAATNILPIQMGQQAAFDTNGIFQAAQGPVEGGSFSIDNSYEPINLGVQAMIGGAFAPVYLDVAPAVTGVETFTPVVSVMVWFDRTLSTSTMFTSAVSRTMEIDFTGITAQTVSYVSDPKANSGIWIYGNPTSGQGLQYVPHKIYHPLSDTFEDLPFADDHNAIRALLDRYLSSPLGKSVMPQPQFLVQATITLPASGYAAEAVTFLKAYLPMAVVAKFMIQTDQGAGPGKAFTAKLAWNKLVQLKTVTAGEDDAAKLKELFKSALSVYGPGYLSATFATLKEIATIKVQDIPSLY